MLSRSFPWAVYPRASYFQKRLTSLVTRFRNVTDKLPLSPCGLTDADRNSLEESVKKYTLPLQIVVTGKHHLKLCEYLADLKPAEQPSSQTSPSIEDSGITVYICHVKVEETAGNFQKELDEAIKYINSSCTDSLSRVHFQIDIPSGSSLSRKDITQYIAMKVQVPESRVFFKEDNMKLASSISFQLEKDLINELTKIQKFLKKFWVSNHTTDDKIFDIRGLLNGGMLDDSFNAVMKDYKDGTKQEYGNSIKGQHTGTKPEKQMKDQETDSMEVEHTNDDTEDKDEAFYKSLAQMIRNHLCSGLTHKYRLRPWLCNKMLVESMFDEEVRACLSSKDKEVSVLKSAIKNILEDTKVQAHVAEIEKTASVIRKMLIEIDGYLQQTITVTEPCQPTSKQPKIPDELRKELLKLDKVYSVATVFHELEIHLYDKEARSPSTEAMETESPNKGLSLQSPQTGNHALEAYKQTEKDIKEVLKKHKFTERYTVKIVDKLPQPFAGSQLESGSQIYRIKSCGQNKAHRYDTVGAFMGDDNNEAELYGITCAHVVNLPGDDHNLYKKTRKGFEGFAEKKPETIISTGEDASLIDFAAIKVKKDYIEECEQHMKDEDGFGRKWFITSETANDLVGKPVFKHGGSTGLTTGIVASDDWTGVENSDQYLISIEPEPGFDGLFIEKGDSGSVVCTTVLPQEAGEPILSAISMVNSGNMKGQGVNNTLSFRLSSAVDSLSNKSNVRLVVTRDSIASHQSTLLYSRCQDLLK